MYLCIPMHIITVAIYTCYILLASLDFNISAKVTEGSLFSILTIMSEGSVATST